MAAANRGQALNDLAHPTPMALKLKNLIVLQHARFVRADIFFDFEHGEFDLARL
jgi:hypothetical protein